MSDLIIKPSGTSANFKVQNPSGTDKIVMNSSGTITTGTLGSGVTFPAGHVLQVIESKKTDTDSVATGSMSTFTDIAGTDQAGAGSVFCCKITPSSSSNKVFVIATGAFGMNAAWAGSLRVKRTVSSTDSTPYLGDTASGYHVAGSATAYGGSSDGNNNETFAMLFLDSPNADNVEVTYTLQGATQGGTMRINGLGNDNANQTYSLRSPSSIILMEIKV